MSEKRKYDELIKILRDGCTNCKLWDGHGCRLDGDCTGCMRIQAADAIEALLKIPTPIMPFFPICNCIEKIERTDCTHYDEEQDMGAHIPYCKLYKRSGYCPCLGCEKYERKVAPLPKLPKEET